MEGDPGVVFLAVMTCVVTNSFQEFNLCDSRWNEQLKMVLEEMDVSTIEVAARSQLKKYGDYLQELIKKSDQLLTTEHHSADWSLDPILLQSVPYEKGNALELLRSGNQTLDKTLAALATLVMELDKLETEAQRNFIPALMVYGDSDGRDVEVEGGALRMLARYLPFLQELSVFIQRCYLVTKNVIYQMASLYKANRSNDLLSVTDIHFVYLLEKLGGLFTVLITMDEVIAHHRCLKDHWSSFYTTVMLVQHNPDRFNVAKSELKPLERDIVMKLELQVFSGFIFQNCVEQPFDTPEISVTQNSVLMEELSVCIKTALSKFEQRLDSGEIVNQMTLVSVTALYLCHYFLFRVQDKKLFRSIWDIQKKVPCIHLAADIIWSVNSFLLSKLPQIDKLVDKKATFQVKTARSNDFLLKTQILVRDIDVAVRRACEWSSKMKTALKSWSSDINSDLDTRYRLFLEGLNLAENTGNLVRYVLNGHLAESKGMGKTTAHSLFRMIELLKEIESVFRSHWTLFLESSGHISQRWSGIFLKSVEEIVRSLRSNKKYSEKNVDRLSAYVIAEKALLGPASKERLLVLNLALAAGSYQKMMKGDEGWVAQVHLDNVVLMADFASRFRRSCDCSVIFWHRNLLPAYFSAVLTETEWSPNRLPNFFAAIADCVTTVSAARHIGAEEAVAAFETEIWTTFEEHFLTKLCQFVETDLRLSIHGHLQLDERNPLKNTEETKCYEGFIHLPPLRLRSRAIDIKRYVEKYLDRTFYNLTTVALHDWKTYAEMRQLARQKYDLTLTETHLPSQTLEQGLDVLEIMRNIHIFVTNYLYNLNTQVFIERSTNSRHLNTLTTRHIANSIRTHGTGIMSTTVNFTYQFLRKKFFVFSQFLFDDQIKSKLLKDARFFRDNKDKLGGMYPVERAEKFNRAIRKLGLSPDGLSFLDRFRILISHIGNALGYVRLVRAGGLQACSEAAQFIPDLEDIVPLRPLCEEAGLSQETLGAAEAFDALISDLVRNFAEGTEYFKLLVDVFTPEFQNSKQIHLKTFYVIIPPLTVNYVEHMVNSKERLGKKGQAPGCFTDDGFAMGIAYILKLLNQHDDFDSLQWFRGIEKKFSKEREEIHNQQKSNSGQGTGLDEKLQQTLTLRLRRSQLHKREFEMVSYALRSARIFFRTDVETELIPKEREGASETSSVKSQAIPSTPVSPSV